MCVEVCIIATLRALIVALLRKRGGPEVYHRHLLDAPRMQCHFDKDCVWCHIRAFHVIAHKHTHTHTELSRKPLASSLEACQFSVLDTHSHQRPGTRRLVCMWENYTMA